MSGTGWRVREARPGDLAGLVELYCQLVEDDASDSQPLTGTAGSRILREMLGDPRRALLVAEGEEGLAGTVDQLIVANLTHRGRPWTIVENMVVDQAVRRRGVGASLMGAVVERARWADCYKIQLLSRKVRTGAHAFYRSLGFEESALGLRLYL